MIYSYIYIYIEHFLLPLALLFQKAIREDEEDDIRLTKLRRMGGGGGRYRGLRGEEVFGGERFQEFLLIFVLHFRGSFWFLLFLHG